MGWQLPAYCHYGTAVYREPTDHLITMANQNEGSGGAASQEHSSSSSTPSDNESKPPVFMSNNFLNYRRDKAKAMELRQQQQMQRQKDDVQNHQAEQQHSFTSDQTTPSTNSLWDHFVNPLSSSSDTKPNPSQHAPSTILSPSVFSDLERSQTVDRFANIFMKLMGDVMSSGKLSSAWKNRGGSAGDESGTEGGMFSWLTKDYSKGVLLNDTTDDTTTEESINPDDYAAERNMIQPHLTPFIWGASCMVVTLASLRFGRWKQGRQLASSLGKTATNASKSNHRTVKDIGTIQDLRNNPQGSNYGNYNNTPFNQANRKQSQKALANLTTLPVDMALSILVGISTSIFLSRPHFLLRDFAESPSLQGRSVLREELCGEFSNEMERVNERYHTYNSEYNPEKGAPIQKQVVSYREMWKDENLGEFDSLRAIRDFVDNCHKVGAVGKKFDVVFDETDKNKR